MKRHNYSVNRRCVGILFLIALLFSACATQDPDAAAQTGAGIESVYTDLGGGSCRTEIDRTDPNETPNVVCPGVAGYSLIVRRVDSGRRSVEVVDPAGEVHPLDYQEFVTRHMSSLRDKAEWRVQSGMPVALIVGVEAREDNNDPSKVTQTYWAVAKITMEETCVTDRIPEGPQAQAEARAAADSARSRPCAQPQPPMLVDGVVVR